MSVNIYNATTGQLERVAGLGMGGSSLYPHLAIIAVTGSTVTATKGSVVTPLTETSTGVYEADLSEYGTYTISASKDGETKTETLVVDTVKEYSLEIGYIPEGSTVLPTDDIQTWLACAGITNKSYTTLSEVLADSTTLLALMSDNNAVDYLVRSKTWTGREALVPIMTGDTTPSGEVIYNHIQSGNAWKDFDNDVSTYGMLFDHRNPTSADGNSYVGYGFPTKKVVNAIKYTQVSGYATVNTGITKVLVYGTDDKTTPLSNLIATIEGLTPTQLTSDIVSFSNTTAYKYYVFQVELIGGSTNIGGFAELQLYSPEGVCDNSTAMTDIGANNYCANTLLADSDWCTAICNSTYFESVLNVKVPTMTSDTTPSGVCSASTSYGSGYAPWKAFDGDNSTYWDASNNSNQWLAYKFTSPQTIYLVKFGTYSTSPKTCKIQANVSGNWTEAKSFTEANGYHSSEYLLDTILTSDEWRFFFSDAYAAYPGITYLQFYGRADV